MLLCVKISHNTNTQQTTPSQPPYIDSLLKKFHLEDANPMSTPLDPNINLNEDSLLEDVTHILNLYATMIGLLMYATLGMCPDITYATHQLTHFTNIPACVLCGNE
jgi:uncharacterized membrane protein